MVVVLTWNQKRVDFLLFYLFHTDVNWFFKYVMWWRASTELLSVEWWSLLLRLLIVMWMSLRLWKLLVLLVKWMNLLMKWYFMYMHQGSGDITMVFQINQEDVVGRRLCLCLWITLHNGFRLLLHWVFNPRISGINAQNLLWWWRPPLLITVEMCQLHT